MAIQTRKLENGMQVVLEENHAAKVVSFNALVNVGSAHESDAEAGICHVIEHMLFKGTPTRPTGTIARDIEAAGGEINAYTSIDQTVFYINMASRFADKGLAILADAVQNPLFDATELNREKEVILEEIRREQDNPGRMITEHLFRESFSKHTYGRPIIGYPETVKSFSRDEILGFYRKWYSPQNISMIAVGDFESAKMLDEIRRIFSEFKGPPPPETQVPVEPDQKNPRFVVRPMNIQSAYLAIGFHVPEIVHPDVPSLDILSHIIGGAESSRLEQEIKEKARLVHNIYSYAFTPKHPGLFVIGAMLADKDCDRAISAIREEVEKVKVSSVLSSELARAKLNIRSNETYEKETVGGEAAKIASFLATAGSYEFEKQYYQMISSVSADQVREAAEKYLNFFKATAVLLVPNKSKWTTTSAKLLDNLSSARQKTAKSSAKGRPGAKKICLKNGIRLIVLENHNLPLVAMCASVCGGTRFENRKTNGLSGLMARLLTKGTTSRTAVAIAKDIEKMAGHIDGFSGRNTVGLKVEFISEHLRDGFRLFADVLTRPSFASSEFAKEKRLLISAIKDQEDALSSLAFAEFLKILFPNHPYGLKILGSKDSVRGFRRNDVVKFHQSVFKSGDLVLSVVGDVNTLEVEKLADELLCNLPQGRQKRPEIPLDRPPASILETTMTKREKQQSHIVLGFQGTTFKSKDRYAMAVLNNILAGQGGRLFSELRDKMSLAYAVNAVNQEGIEPGFFAVYIGTEPGKQQRAIEGIISELTRIRTELVSKEEIERSKQYLVGTYELDLQRNGMLAGIYAFNEVYGIAIGEIEMYPQRVLAVTREDVLKAAARYIRPDAYALAVIKPAK